MEQKSSSEPESWKQRLTRFGALFILSWFSFLIKVMMGTFLIAIGLLKKAVRKTRSTPLVGFGNTIPRL